MYAGTRANRRGKVGLAGVHRLAELCSPNDYENIVIGASRLRRCGATHATDGTPVAVLETLTARHEAQVDYKVLQTISLLVRPHASLTRAVLKRCVGVCAALMDVSHGEGGIKVAALAALDQSAMSLLDVSAKDERIAEMTAEYLTELCLVPGRNDAAARGAPADEEAWIPAGKMPNRFAIELIEAALSGFAPLFSAHPTFATLVKTRAAPLLLSVRPLFIALDKG